MTNWVIAYDVRDPRRLARVHRLLTNHACLLQFSVFLFSGSWDGVSRLLEELGTLMDLRVDDLRCYEVMRSEGLVCLGRGMYPDGVYLGGVGGGLLLDGRC